MMNSITGFSFLRPRLALGRDVSAARRAAYLSFFHTTTRVLKKVEKKEGEGLLVDEGELSRRGDVQRRVKELRSANALLWPRIRSNKDAVTAKEFWERYKGLKNGERKDEECLIRGRVMAIRAASAKLVFLDVIDDGVVLQVVCNLRIMADLGSGEDFGVRFRDIHRLITRGDIISIYGHPYTTLQGQLSIEADTLPKILSPSLASLPTTLEQRETRIRNRHIDLLANPSVAHTLRLRSSLIQGLRTFLLNDNFIEVSTPLIASDAGGAIAKPFITTATEFPSKQLSLRIAPELWLKRLVIGGLSRVFEIGPAFRNEGVDTTHNPEFTTCEFYKAYATLDELMSMTQSLLSSLVDITKNLRAGPLKELPPVDETLFDALQKPFRRLEFIPTIESSLGFPFPNLTSEDAEEKITAIFKENNLPLPKSPTLQRLLDKLAEIYIEPRCKDPTFITHHPALTSPLSKSFLDEKSGQVVAARAELFVKGMELVNMYEEENSPFEQRLKMEEQAGLRDREMATGSDQGGWDDEKMGVDEAYLEALESALGPTGGWGMGVDRCVMLLGGASRIGDVLSFGSVRNVVGLGTGWSGKVKEGERKEKGEKKDGVVGV